MAVAKSFQSYKIIDGPVVGKNGKEYVTVEKPDGLVKTVRWYSPAEYEKLYNEPAPETENKKSQKEVLGFEKGYITIFQGDTFPHKEWMKEHGARYHKVYGWYFISTMDMPEDIPEGIKAVRLPWEVVGDENGKLYNDDVVKAAVDFVLFEPDPSQFVGEIGDKLNVTVTIERAVPLQGYYGPSMMHIMRDADKNVYVWTTAARQLTEGRTYTLRGTVKDHKVYHATRQTILTRCRVIEKED